MNLPMMPELWLVLLLALAAMAAMAAVVAVHLYRKVAALDRRLAELEDIVGDDWDAAPEPEIDWQACLTGPALAAMVHGINDRQHAMERWEQERDYESAV